MFSLISLPNQNKVKPRRATKASSIQYGYKNSGTHARVFSLTLAHENSKNRETEKGAQNIVKMKKSKLGTK